VAFGSIQVPADGQPIVLMADRQTTGGYAKIATVISTDLPRVAQVRPGGKLAFRAVELGWAQDRAAERERFLEAFRAGVSP
jgi:antagonist of KipI